MTLLEVIDTAVKVGLGALISGFSTYWVSARKSKDDLTRERLLRNHSLLESSAEQIELHSHLILRYWALMMDVVRQRNTGCDIQETRLEELKKVKSDLFNSYSEVTRAESKLLLLGHNEAQRLLRKYGEMTIDFRRNAHYENRSLTEEKLQQDRKNILAARDSLFLELSRVYRSEPTTLTSKSWLTRIIVPKDDLQLPPKE